MFNVRTWRGSTKVKNYSDSWSPIWEISWPFVAQACSFSYVSNGRMYRATSGLSNVKLIFSKLPHFL